MFPLFFLFLDLFRFQHASESRMIAGLLVLDFLRAWNGRIWEVNVLWYFLQFITMIRPFVRLGRRYLGNL